jgi:molecular chaperone GrpE
MNDERVQEEAGDILDELVDEVADGTGDAALEEQLAAAQAEAARYLDGWQRTQAEFANARKRFEKQRAEAYTNANADLVSKLLPLIDDLERALSSAPEAIQRDPWFAGVGLVYRKMMSVLEDMDVYPIPAVGEMFDPNLHEALSPEPSSEHASGVIVREVRRGYRLGDQVIRPSLVTVAA